MTEYPNWYNIIAVRFKLISYTFNREFCFIRPNYSKEFAPTTRMLRIHNINHLGLWLKTLHMEERKYNLYYSLAKYKTGIPYGSLALDKRDFGDWNKNHWEQMVSYDYVVDIDCKNHKEINFAYYSTQQIKKLFDKFDVPYYLRFSGMGFHFIIPYEYFEFKEGDVSFNPKDDNSIYKFFMCIAMRLHDNYSQMIDTSIYDSRRIIKLPYSISLYDGKEYLCGPFDSNDDFNGFILKSMNPVHFIGHVREMNDILFNEDGNIFKLLNELKIKNV